MHTMKKAVAFNLALVVVEIILLTSALLILSKEMPPYKIGERQNALFRTNEKAQDALLYIDLAAELAITDSFYALYDNGMYASDTKRGDYLGYPYWKTEYGGAYPTDMHDDFITLFNDELNVYLENYHERYIPGNNYEVSITEHADSITVTGIAHQDIAFDIYGRESDRTVEPVGETGIVVSHRYTLEGSERSTGAKVDRIILHHTGDDSAQKTYAALKSRGLSVHYIISRDGTIYHVVDENMRAAHASGWNDRSIGIEIVNTGHKDMEYTDAQYDSVQRLITDIGHRWQIPIDSEHVIGHYQASTSGKWDPSPNFDWSRIGLAQHVTIADLGKQAPKEMGYG